MKPEQETKPIKKYEIIVDWHLQKLKEAIMTHYKDVNLEFNTWRFMDVSRIQEIWNNLANIINNCKEHKQ